MSEETEIFFHNEEVVMRLAVWSNIIAWIALVIGVLSFGNIVYFIASNPSQVFAPAGSPNAIFNNINVIASQLLAPLTGGIFVFFVLQGLSQLLNMGLDMFALMDEEESLE